PRGSDHRALGGARGRGSLPMPGASSRGRGRPRRAQPLLRRVQHDGRAGRCPWRPGRGRVAGIRAREGALMASGRLGVALLGAGRLGAAHAGALGGLAEVQLVIVADPAAAARELGARFGARAVADAREAILDPAVEAVVIVTPTGAHAAQIETAAHARKAI